MHITNVLRQLNYLRYFRRLWKKQATFAVQDLGIPPEIREMNIKVHDSKEILLETKMFKPVVPVIVPIWIKPPSIYANVDNIVYLMNNSVKVSENENQTLSLTKTVAYTGLPSILNTLVGIESVPNQDSIIQNFILQSSVLDSIQSKLPRKVDIKRPTYIAKREFGILKERKTSNLLEKFSIHCDSVSGKYAEAFKRNKFLDAFSEVTVQRGMDTVVFQMVSDILLTSKTPLKCFSLPANVEETVKLEVPNIYPIKCTLDLEKCDTNPAKWGKSPGVPSSSYVHTTFLTQKSDDIWFPNQMLSRAIATCFSFTAAEARRRYGIDVEVLPQPVCIQCAYMDLNTFNFIAYQLNTLDFSHDEGIKNQVWIDTPSNLYSDISEMNEIMDYNKGVISKILSMHLNGLHPISL